MTFVHDVSERLQPASGSVVRVRAGQLDEWWPIVPRHEADAGWRLIAEDTTMTKALLGHRAGERVYVESPARGPRDHPGRRVRRAVAIMRARWRAAIGAGGARWYGCPSCA